MISPGSMKYQASTFSLGDTPFQLLLSRHPTDGRQSLRHPNHTDIDKAIEEEHTQMPALDMHLETTRKATKTDGRTSSVKEAPRISPLRFLYLSSGPRAGICELDMARGRKRVFRRHLKLLTQSRRVTSATRAHNIIGLAFKG